MASIGALSKIWKQSSASLKLTQLLSKNTANVKLQLRRPKQEVLRRKLKQLKTTVRLKMQRLRALKVKSQRAKVRMLTR